MISHPSNPTSMGGDFFALLAAKQMRPCQVDPATVASLQTEATTVFAFHCRDGVLVAGDRRATAGHVIITDDIEKIVEIDSHSVLAIAGVPATAFEMARVLQTSFEYYRRSQLQPLSLPAKVRALARLLRENMPMALQGVGIVVPLFAGVDLDGAQNDPKIFFYDPLGAQFQAVGNAASGSGSMTIRSVLCYQERFGEPKPAHMELPEAVRFALRLLMVAAQFDSATGGVNPPAKGFANIKLLKRSGVETITEDQQVEYLGT